MKTFKFSILASLIIGLLSLSACSDDDAPPAENEEEVIDQVTLIFTPTGGTPLTFNAEGEGGVNFTIPTIMLDANTEYALSVEVRNTAEGENITEEIEEEDEEHMFFYGWTNGLFSDPSGDGNIGPNSRSDDVNYNDQDANGYPVGLSTTWATSDAATGEFRIILKHQPDIKTATSTSNDGESDIDLVWDIEIQ
ncbi:MAG: hypothetical protein ABJH05_15325 [Fulvivirga sp.]